MKERDLTEVIGKRDGQAISRALSTNWDNWDRFEKPEALYRINGERRRRREFQLAKLGIRYVSRSN